eukprot:GEMP01006168.1.p1 GENE.GEMP01006168.1~~GEMP01006168.1.p1  ORF type:complete len:953 (+),score=249.21 GEMP01006168.1:36-2894(+)
MARPGFRLTRDNNDAKDHSMPDEKGANGSARRNSGAAVSSTSTGFDASRVRGDCVDTSGGFDANRNRVTSTTSVDFGGFYAARPRLGSAETERHSSPSNCDDNNLLEWAGTNVAKKSSGLEGEDERNDACFMEEAHKSEELRLTEERTAARTRRAEELRESAKVRLARDARVAEKTLLVEERCVEEVRTVEEARKVGETKKVEGGRVAGGTTMEQARIAEGTRKAAEGRKADEAGIAEEVINMEEALDVAEVRKAKKPIVTEEAKTAELAWNPEGEACRDVKAGREDEVDISEQERNTQGTRVTGGTQKAREARIPEAKQVGEEAMKAKLAQKAEEETHKKEEAMKANTTRKAESGRKVDESRKSADGSKAGEARNAEETLLTEIARLVEDTKMAERVRLINEPRWEEDDGKSEDAGTAGAINTKEARLVEADKSSQAEGAHRVEKPIKVEDARNAEEMPVSEEAMKSEETRIIAGKVEEGCAAEAEEKATALMRSPKQEELAADKTLVVETESELVALSDELHNCRKKQKPLLLSRIIELTNSCRYIQAKERIADANDATLCYSQKVVAETEAELKALHEERGTCKKKQKQFLLSRITELQSAQKYKTAQAVLAETPDERAERRAHAEEANAEEEERKYDDEQWRAAEEEEQRTARELRELEKQRRREEEEWQEEKRRQAERELQEANERHEKEEEARLRMSEEEARAARLEARKDRRTGWNFGGKSDNPLVSDRFREHECELQNLRTNWNARRFRGEVQEGDEHRQKSHIAKERATARKEDIAAAGGNGGSTGPAEPTFDVVSFPALRGTTLKVEDEYGAGLDLEPSWWGMKVLSIGDEVQQDFHAGDTIVSINGFSLAQLGGLTCEMSFGNNFGNGVSIVVDVKVKLRAHLPYIPTGLIDDITVFGAANEVAVEMVGNVLTISGCSTALQYCQDEATKLLRYHYRSLRK